MANTEDKEFQFDHVLDMTSNQDQTFQLLGQPILDNILEGYNSTLMAYGQTGSGKTYTVFGSRHSIETIGKPGIVFEDTGLVPRMVENLFEYIGTNPKKAQFRITVSFLQIYLEKITDLLSANPYETDRSSYATNGNPNGNLLIREDPKTGIFVHGLTQKKIHNKEELLNIVKRGARFRSTNSTSMNQASSRSHAILQIFVEQRWVEKQNNDDLNQDIKPEKGTFKLSLTYSHISTTGIRASKKRHHRKALLTIVDLAGSERVSKSGIEGQRLAEAKNINKAISALGNCISALVKKQKNK